MAQAGLWGLLAGGALLIGAFIGWFLKVPVRLIAAIMAFGSGVLISALSFDLMDEAFKRGCIESAALGFFSGAVTKKGASFSDSFFRVRIMGFQRRMF